MYAERTFITAQVVAATVPQVALVDGQTVGNALAAIVKVGDAVRSALGK